MDQYATESASRGRPRQRSDLERQVGRYVLPDADHITRMVRKNATVIDCGCFGWPLAGACADRNHTLIGLDQVEPPGRPPGAEFAVIEGASFDVTADRGDLLVASHVMEHIVEPSSFFREMVRVTKPGGVLFIETPSEMTNGQPGSDVPEDHEFVSFWDDPTHVRPWTPGALYRLALSCCTVPLVVGRGQNGPIHVVRMLARKPSAISGQPDYRYISLKGVPRGVAAAWHAFWPDVLLTERDTDETTHVGSLS